MFREGFRWAQKPPMGTPLDPSDPIGGSFASCWPLYEGGGTGASDAGPNRAHATWVGTPNWVSTPYGGGMTSLVTTVYIKADAAAPLMCATPPFWLFADAIIPSGNATGNCLVSQGWATNAIANLISIVYTNGVLAYNLRDSAGVNASFSVSGLSLADGKEHRYHVRTTKPTATTYLHTLSVDGVQLGSGTTAIGSLASTLFTIGAARSSTVTNSAKGPVLLVGGGPGAGPDPMAAHMGLWGAFATPWLRRSAFIAGAATGGPWPFFMDNALAGGMQPMGL